jgi:ubiquinone/menaquinone biosynthesis C-methylase UbiE
MSDDHSDAVADLFNRKAPGWSAKYGGDPRVGWRLPSFAAALARHVAAPARVLDLGCGTGDLGAHLASRGYTMTAADTATAMIASGKEAHREGIRWVALEAGWTRLPFEPGAFDGIVMSSVLEYVTDAGLVLAECARVLREGGVLVASVPDVRHPTRRFEKVLAAVAASEPARRVIRRIPRAASYASYLALSKNRFALGGWESLATTYGLARRGLVETRGPLMILTFQKSAPGAPPAPR